MSPRPLLSFWPLVSRQFCALVLIALAHAVFFCINGKPLLAGLALPFIAVCIVVSWRRHPSLRSLAWAVRNFRTISNGRISVYYQPSLTDDIDKFFLLQCGLQLDRLTELFGSPLRNRMAVYVFENYEDIQRIFGRGCGGLAIPQARLIVIAADNGLNASMRHEVAHLFAHRWNPNPPALLGEGIAVHVERMDDPRSTDEIARKFIKHRNLRLSQLLNRQFFFSEEFQNQCYNLAGSFTGFLIRRYGWEKYQQVYKLSGDSQQLTQILEKVLGETLDHAEWKWRNELFVPEVLRRRLGINLGGRAR